MADKNINIKQIPMRISESYLMSNINMISNAHYHNFDEMVLDCTSIRSRFEIEFDLQTSDQH